MEREWEILISGTGIRNLDLSSKSVAAIIAFTFDNVISQNSKSTVWGLISGTRMGKLLISGTRTRKLSIYGKRMKSTNF